MPSSAPPSVAWSGYTDAEWREISSAVLAAELTPLSSTDRETLNWVANQYRELVQSRDGSAPVVAKRWMEVARVTSKLTNAVLDAKKSQLFCNSIFWAMWRRTDAADEAANAASLEEILASCRQGARLTAHFAKQYAKSNKNYLRQQFYQEVLRTWFQHGGIIKYSTSGKKRGGPLITYFQAVTGPVLEAVPPAETIRSFLDRMKKAGKKTDAALGTTLLADIRALP